ncbi:MAG: hypothetical protein K0R51_993 [Cytophagaceae bacterium]|jgi:hypothetical protein|nr:hypothetical protein [Cytophagaceae bacterium]
MAQENAQPEADNKVLKNGTKKQMYSIEQPYFFKSA